jgi:copper chaperone CopZ
VTNEILTIPGVTNVIASAEKATAVIESSSDISDELIEIAVRNAGYAVNK